MTPPFFSICIAAYNADRYIDECLRSVAEQEYRDYEVVIVDDGSVEPLVLGEDVLASLSACTLKRTVNGGPYSARQTAFDIARGEIILCIDADDGLLDPLALMKIRMAFVDDVDIVLFNATSSRRSPSRMFDFSVLGESGTVAESAIWDLFTKGYSLNSLWCKAFKKSLYVKSKKNRPRLLMAEDRLQSLEVMRDAQGYRLIDEPLYYYRPNPSSTTNDDYNPVYYRQACYVEDEVVAFMKARSMPLNGWARYFLGYTSNALLGIRYNRRLKASERRSAYMAVREEHVLNLAYEHCLVDSLGKMDELRLKFLQLGWSAALDASMLPWRIGSGLKRILRRGLGGSV